MRDQNQIMHLEEAYTKLLDNTAITEPAIQDFLETHSELIPTPWMLNHGLHLDFVISKFPLDTSLVCDWAYLTKSTQEWYLVLMELERPAKAIFLQSDRGLRFSADFNAALGQIETWQVFIDRHYDEVVERVSPLLRPLSENRVHFRFALIYGRNSELRSQQLRVDRLAARSSDKLKILTYDSLLNGLRERGGYPKNLLTVSGRAFKLKRLKQLSTSMFAYLFPHELVISSGQAKRLRSAGYQINRWKNGALLCVNQKYPNTRSYLRSDDFKQLVRLGRNPTRIPRRTQSKS